MPANQGMTEDQIKSYVKRKLGDGIVKVELTDDHLDDVMRDSRRWFINRVGVEIFYDFLVMAGESVYILPDHIVDVYDIWLPGGGLAALSGTDDFTNAYRYFFGLWYSQGYGSTGGGGGGHGQDQMPYSNLVQRLQYLEQIERIWGADSDWLYDPRMRKLNIMSAPGSSGPAMARVNSTQFDTTKLDPEEEDLFLRWALAEAKETLGRIRSKYDSVPTVGGDRSLDGDTLLTAAETEKEALERQAMDRKQPVGRFIVVG